MVGHLPLPPATRSPLTQMQQWQHLAVFFCQIPVVSGCKSTPEFPSGWVVPISVWGRRVPSSSGLVLGREACLVLAGIRGPEVLVLWVRGEPLRLDKE